jgi:hypothetical protein
VVRLCAKSRETVASPVEHLTLHYIVKHLDTPDRSELRKLQQVRCMRVFELLSRNKQFVSFSDIRATSNLLASVTFAQQAIC